MRLGVAGRRCNPLDAVERLSESGAPCGVYRGNPRDSADEVSPKIGERSVVLFKRSEADAIVKGSFQGFEFMSGHVDGLIQL